MPRAKAKEVVKAKGVAKATGGAKAKAKSSASTGPPLHESGSDEDYAIPGPAPPPPPAAPKMLRMPKKKRKLPKKIPVSAILGATEDPGEVVYDEWAPVDEHKPRYRNWTMTCPHHRSDGCQRTLGLGLTNTGTHGLLEPLAFLHVWRDTPADPSRGHRKTPVPAAAVHAYFREHEAELNELAEKFGAPTGAGP